MSTGTSRLIKQIGDLYLNEKLSDVTIIVEGVKLPAHRLILAQRCEYFQTMFECGLSESTLKCVEIRETSVEGFKAVLEWFYTGCIHFNSLDNAFKVLRLAHMYQIIELIYEAVKYIWPQCTAENVCAILNEAVLLSLNPLTDCVLKFVNMLPYSGFSGKSFETLSTDALNIMLTRRTKFVSDVFVFYAVVSWMKANPTKSADFPSILKNVPLTWITFEDGETVPPVLDHNVLAERAYQLKVQKRIPYYQRQNENVAFLKNGMKVIHGGALFDEEYDMLIQRIGSSVEGILIDLGRQYLINFVTMNVRSFRIIYSYWVAVSEDNVNWTRVIDRSKYPCRDLQNLYFESRYVRYIRIFGTAPDHGVLYVSKFQALYTTMSYNIDPKTTLMIPSHIVATFEEFTLHVNGYSKPEHAFIVGIPFEYDRSNGCKFREYVFRLHETYIVETFELPPCRWDSDDRVHSYDIEVSIDQMNWTRVLCVEKVALCRSIHFDRQPVYYVKITAYTLPSIN